MYKAKIIDTLYGKYSNIVKYEYRGYTYEIEFANDFSYAACRYEDAPRIHREEQERINKLIENNSKPKPERKEPEIDWDKALDEIFEMWENYEE